jgi:soluble lytic murein transglycosylase-like protein/TolA-binding protein
MRSRLSTTRSVHAYAREQDVCYLQGMRSLIAALTLAALAVGCGARHAATPPPVAVASATDARAAFARAYQLSRRGDDERALPIFAALVTDYPALADYHLAFVGQLSLRLGRTEAAAAVFTRLLRDYPQSVQAPAAALELGKLLGRAGRIDEARAQLERALAAPDAGTALGARLALADLDADRGDVVAAYAEFMTVRRSTVGSMLGRTAKQRVLALRQQHPELAPAGTARLDEARLLLAERDYAAADAMATDILAQPDGIEPAEAARVHADVLYGQGQTAAALVALREVADDYPRSAAAPAALFRLASLLWNRDDDAAALRCFDEFRQRYPENRQAPGALYAIGRIHQGAGHTTLAISALTDLVQHYPESPLSTEARWRIGWIHYLAADWPAAATGFSLLARHTQGREHDEATYWYARTLEHAGRLAAARQSYQGVIDADPTGYYSLWAQGRLTSSAPDLQALLTPIAITSAPVALDLAAPAPLADGFHLQRAHELQATGIYSLARGELAAVERDHHDDPSTLRYLLGAYQSVDGFSAALRLARRLDDRTGLSPSERERLLYPLAFWTTVQREAETEAVDPLLVMAVMRQESLFDPEARSTANARGLMQLLPATARRIAGEDHSSDDEDDLTQPDVNIHLGVRYLRALLDDFNGDPLKAVAAYNAGEGAVRKWERQFAHLEADEFVESITFRETRDYVKRVLANYGKYRSLYQG